jgi:glycosyltransferase involved in cell wall biosynthesis
LRSLGFFRDAIVALSIVHVLPSLVKGGAERVAVDLANNAAARGDRVSVVAGKRADESLLRTQLDPRIEVRYVTQGTSRTEPYRKLLPWILRNREWIFGHDVLHCHLSFGSIFGSCVQLLRRLSGGKGPAVLESYQAVAAPIPRFNRWLHARLAARRDAFAIMADDGYWGAFLERHPGLPSAIIPNGIAPPAWQRLSPDEQARYRREIGLPEDCEQVLLTIGRVVAERRPWIFLPIFRKVADAKGPGVHFVFGGEGPASERLLEEAAAHGLAGRVHVTGLVREPAVPLSIADVYVTLNVGPVTGIAALEAVFFGLPVVAVQIFPGYDKGSSDWIRSGTDPAELAAEVVELLRHPESRNSLAARQRAHAEANLTVEAASAAYDDLYRRALERLGSGAARAAP